MPKGSNRNIGQEIGCFPQIPSQDVLRKSYGCPMLALWKAMKVYPLGEKRPYFQPCFNTTHVLANSIHCKPKARSTCSEVDGFAWLWFFTQSNWRGFLHVVLLFYFQSKKKVAFPNPICIRTGSQIPWSLQRLAGRCRRRATTHRWLVGVGTGRLVAVTRCVFGAELCELPELTRLNPVKSKG